MRKILIFLCTMIISITAGLSLIACGAKYPTITFMDGDTTIVAVKSQDDLNAQLANGVTKDGYKFLGYFLDKECSIPFDVNNMPEGNFNVYTSWLALDGYSKVTVSADAILNVGVTFGLDADATVLYRETTEGIDFIIDAVAEVAGVAYNAKIYYVDGFFAVGTSTGDEALTYEKENVGTLKEIKEDLLEDSQFKLIYDFVADVLAKNNITTDTLKQMFLLPPKVNIDNTVDIAQDVTGLIDTIIAIKDEPIYDLILSSLVPQDEIDDAKLSVDEFLEELFDDEISIEGFINKLLGLANLDIDGILTAIDNLQERYKIETQDVIDLISGLAGTEYPEAEKGQTITEYVSNAVNLEGLLKTKLGDILSGIIGAKVNPSDLLPTIKIFRDSVTISSVVDLVLSLVGSEIGIDEILTVADSIVFEKLEFAVEVKTNIKGLLTKLALGTDDVIILGDSTYSVDVDLAIDLEYGLYGENVFIVPVIAD